ncbi:MAG: archaeal proteasome endopeptidase complex subunit beta, partial [Candidatus Aenigmatarchaeota archaeon]
QSASLAKPAYITADKGYDSESNHRLVKQLGSKPMIPVRKRRDGKTYGSYRKKMLRHFDNTIYHKRSLVETVNSVMKRLMGSWLQSRSLVHQCNEVVLMCAIYNVHRKIIMGFYGWFLHNRASVKFINPKYLLNKKAQADSMDEEKMEKLKTGTTTVGVVCNGAVVLGAERKATMGYLVASKAVHKIIPVDEHIAITIAGLVGDAQALERYIKAELRLYRLHEERRIPVKAAAYLVANILYARRFYPYYVQLLMGGYDENPEMYSMGADGSVIEEKEYFSTGSGSPMALGVLEDGYRKGMPVEEAKKLVARAINAATKRDIASGGSGIDITVVDSKGVHELKDEEIQKLIE